MEVNFKLVLIHALCVWALTFLGGFIVGFLGALTGGGVSMSAIGFVNMGLIFAGVFLYCFFKRVSWKHFGLVFLFLGALSLFNALFGISLAQIILGTVIVTAVAAAAKGLADLISKKDSDEAHKTFE